MFEQNRHKRLQFQEKGEQMSTMCYNLNLVKQTNMTTKKNVFEDAIM